MWQNIYPLSKEAKSLEKCCDKHPEMWPHVDEFTHELSYNSCEIYCSKCKNRLIIYPKDSKTEVMKEKWRNFIKL